MIAPFFLDLTHFKNAQQRPLDGFIHSLCRGFVVFQSTGGASFSIPLLHCYCDKRAKVNAWQPDAKALEDGEHGRCRI